MPHYDILRLGRAGWLPMVASFFIGLALSGILLFQAWLISRIFATLYAWDFSHITLLLGLFAVVLLVRPLVMLVQELLVSRVGRNIKLDVRVRLLEHLNKMGPFGLSSKRTGEVEALVTDGVELLEDYYGRYIPQLGVTIVTVTVAIVLLFRLDPLVAFVGGCAALLTPILPNLWNKVLSRLPALGTVFSNECRGGRCDAGHDDLAALQQRGAAAEQDHPRCPDPPVRHVVADADFASGVRDFILDGERRTCDRAGAGHRPGLAWACRHRAAVLVPIPELRALPSFSGS